MKRLVTFVAIAALLATAALSMAQGGGGGRGGFGQGRFGMGGMMTDMMLLGRKDVQTDIKFTEDQQKQIHALQERQREEMQGMFQGGGGGGDREAMMKAMQDMQKKYQAEVDKITTADQKKRLKEIRIQLAGSRGALQPDVQKDLGLTPEQVSKLAELQRKQQEANQALMQKVRDGEIERDQLQELRQKNDKALEDEIAKVLTDANKAKLKELAGAPFKADPEEGRRRPPL